MWLKDPKKKEDTKDQSVTLTLMVISFAIGMIKYLFSGITYKSFSIESMDIASFGAFYATVAAAYVGRKLTDRKDENNDGA